MEFRKENLESQMSVLSCYTPNQQACVANEDIASTSEISVERPDGIEVEKTMLFQKKIIINEKYVVPDVAVHFPISHILYGNHTSSIDLNASLLSCEGGFPDSQESGKMEIASQESLYSRMDTSSQGSHLSVMEYSSQESDVPIEPAGDVCIPNNETINSAKAGKDCAALPDVLPKDEYAKKVQTIEKPNCIHEYIPDNENGDLNAEGSISEINGQEYEKYDTAVENEVDYFTRKDPVDEYYDRRLSTKNFLSSREEAVTAREAACMSREKAIEEREAALASQETSLREATDYEVPSPKRLKLISVFEYH